MRDRRAPDDDVESAAHDAGLHVSPAANGCWLPIDKGSAVLVVGAQCRQPIDRSVGRARVRSLQILTRHATISGGTLDRMGALGLRGATPDVLRGRIILNTGDQLTELDVRSRTMTPLRVNDLADVHEVTLLAEGGVLIANSGRDEVVHLDADRVEIERLPLDTFRTSRSRHPIDHAQPLAGALSRRSAAGRDHFHVNHAFVAPDGHRYALVHHVAGFRPIIHAAGQLVGHGSGGILDLDAHRFHPLALRAPHSTRVWGDGFVVLDSGRHRLVTLDRSWHPTRTVGLPGWGRGVDIEPGGALWVGVSATRTRYRRASSRSAPNGVIALAADLLPLAHRPIEHVDEIWAVHLIPASFACDLLDAMAE